MSTTRPARSPRPRAVVALAVCLALVTGVAACGTEQKEATPTTTRPTTSVTTRPDPTIAKGAAVSPLTGLVASDKLSVFRRALAVKVDNLDVPGESARPQAGIVDADVVFEELVEGGITRLVAVFQSRIPARVGPVRSARTTDPILLSQLNQPLFAWSGGNGGVMGAVRASALRDMGYDAQPAAYGRDGSRRSPHNMFVTPGLLYAAAPKDVQPPRSLFAFRDAGEKLSSTAKPVKGVRLDFGGVASAPVSWLYDAKADGWRRTQSGTPHVDDQGRAVVPRNVVILFTPYGASPADPRSPEAQSIGKGEAWVLSKGRIVGGTWERSRPDQAAILKDRRGREIKLTRGKTWIELPKPGGGTVLT